MSVTLYFFAALCASANPETVSWSVNASVLIPRVLAFLTNHSGDNMPSEAVEWVCKSNISDIGFKFSPENLYIVKEFQIFLL